MSATSSEPLPWPRAVCRLWGRADPASLGRRGTGALDLVRALAHGAGERKIHFLLQYLSNVTVPGQRPVFFSHGELVSGLYEPQGLDTPALPMQGERLKK